MSNAQEFMLIVDGYVKGWKEVKEFLTDVSAKDQRFTTIERLVDESLNPYKMKCHETSLEFMEACVHALTDIKAAMVAMFQDETMSAGEAMTVGTVIAHLTALTEMLDETAPDKRLTAEQFQMAFFPTLSKKIPQTFLFNAALDDKYVQMMKKAGFGITFNADQREFVVRTKHGDIAIEV